MSFLDIVVGITGMVLFYTLIVFVLFIWISMFIDAIQQSHWVWALLILWLGWFLAFVYLLFIYKKSPVDELIIKPFKQGYRKKQ